MAPRLSKHIKLLRAHLHSITAYPIVAVSHVPERNDMVEYDEADTEAMNDMDLSGFKSRNHRKYLILVPPAASSATGT